jgi:tripartite-type tricarboxylate transporter receptor subunit TctC
MGEGADRACRQIIGSNTSWDSRFSGARGYFPMLKLRVGLLALVVVMSTTVNAQEWPSRLLRFIVPFPAGGSADVGARLVGEYLSRSLQQQIVVENKSGANGNIGIESAAKSAADGYTVLVTSDVISSNPHVYKMNIDPLKELTPVIQLSRQPIVLAAHPSLGVASLAELTALARQQPGLRYATGSGVGAQHMVVQWFASIAGIKLEQVPYRGGAPAINDLIAGHVKLGSLGSTPLIPHYKAGTLRLLAQSTKARSPSLPDVPTYEEAGIKGLVLDQWVGVFVPTGTPAAVRIRLNREINKALAEAMIRDNFLQSGQEPVGGSAEAFSQLVHGDFETYARLVKELNIKSD